MKKLERSEEIIILLEHLINEVSDVSRNYKSLLADRIIKNGKLIESYKEELNNINLSSTLK